MSPLTVSQGTVAQSWGSQLEEGLLEEESHLDVTLIQHAALPTTVSLCPLEETPSRAAAVISLRYVDLLVMRPAERLDRAALKTPLLAQNALSVPTSNSMAPHQPLRGHGVTQAALKRSSMLDAIHLVARSRPRSMQMPYPAAILAALTRSPVSIHTDQNHCIWMTLALGEYRGGALLLNGILRAWLGE
eukprot:981222-Amphidinium_carterae.9